MVLTERLSHNGLRTGVDFEDEMNEPPKEEDIQVIPRIPQAGNGRTHKQLQTEALREFRMPSPDRTKAGTGSNRRRVKPLQLEQAETPQADPQPSTSALHPQLPLDQ